MTEMREVFGEDEPAGSPSAAEGGREEAPVRWASLVRQVPVDVVRQFEKIDVPFYRIAALYELERRLAGWAERWWRPKGTTAWKRVTPVMVVSLYRDALSKPRRAATLQQVGWVIDATVHAAQVRNLEAHETAGALPEGQNVKAMTSPDGIIEVRDVARPEPTFGVRSFLEPTPIELVAYTFDVHAACGPSLHRPLRVWDLTAGSGTVGEVARLYDAKVVATDLSFENHAVKCGAVQDVGRLPWHRKIQKRYPDTFAPNEEAVTRPDVIFFDPGSRGTPSASSLYFGSHDPRDLAGLSLDAYVETVAAVVEVALSRLADGGLVSLLVREGERSAQRITETPGLADAILTRLGEGAYVVETLKVVEPAPVKQVSLGDHRVPCVHLLLARRDW